MSCLILGNVIRPGAIKNMTIKEFESATTDFHKQINVVAVKKHKTAATSGPSMFSVLHRNVQYRK